jgi:chromosome segregation ATPase
MALAFIGEKNREVGENAWETKFKELREKYDEAAGAVDKYRARGTELEKKQKDLLSKVPELTRKNEQAAKDKETALDRFVSGQIDRNALDTARETAEQAEKATKESQELLDAIERTLKKASQDFPGLNQNLLSAERILWRHVADDIKADVLQAVGDKVLKAYAASCKGSGHVGPLPNFLPALFVENAPSGHLTTERIRELQKAIEEEYFGGSK